jgi:hypothetical protein
MWESQGEMGVRPSGSGQVQDDDGGLASVVGARAMRLCKVGTETGRATGQTGQASRSGKQVKVE